MADYFELRHEDSSVYPVGTLAIDIESGVFEFCLNKEYDGEVPWFVRFERDAVLPMSEMVRMWVMERAPESHNEFIDSLIEKAGLDEYDAYGFFKHNKGHFITDKFYVVEREKPECS